MKRMLILFLFGLHFALNATDIGTRIDICHGDGTTMTLSESSYSGQPMLNFYTESGVSWHMMGNDEIKMKKEIHGPGIFVVATDSSIEPPVTLHFYASRPLDPQEPVHKYNTVVTAHDGSLDHEAMFFEMTCETRKVKF